VSAAICTFGLTAFSFEAVADVIAGKVRPTGRLPVRLSRAMPQGFGVQLR
jgi:hypothetical protein